MNASSNYSLLKNNAPNQVTLSHTRQQLVLMHQQKEHIVKELTKSIEGHRGEMKRMSKEINSIIQKQQKKGNKNGPSKWSKDIVSKTIIKMHQQLQSYYEQNEKLKAEIETAKLDQPEAIAEEMEHLRGKMLLLQRQTQKTNRDKNILIDELQRKKRRIEDLKQNSCLLQLDQSEQQFDNIVKQCKNTEKDINVTTALLLQFNSYYYHMDEIIHKQKIPEEIHVEIDQNQLANLVDDLNALTQERRQLQKDTILKRKKLTDSIADLQKNIKQRQTMIRQLQNDILRAGIQSKRIPTFATEPRKQSIPTKTVKPLNPQAKKTKKPLVNKVYMMQKEEQRTIVVGSWNSQGVVSSDRGENWQHTVQRAKKIVFLQVSEGVVGIRTVYADNSSTSIEGRTILPEGVHSYSEIEVSLEDVATVQFSSENSPIYLKFIANDGTYKEVGVKNSEENLERISLEQYVVKWVEAQVGHSLMGLRLTLDDRPISDKLAQAQTPQKNHLTNRSFSNGNIATRKVLLRGGSLSKLREGALVDYRLTLNKKRA